MQDQGASKELKNPLWEGFFGFFDAQWSEWSSNNLFSEENAKSIVRFQNPIMDCLKETNPKKKLPL